MRNLVVVSFALLISIQLKANNYNIFVSEHTDSIIQACLPYINADSIQHYMLELEGMNTRYAFSENRKDVSEWIASKFKSFGYTDVELQQFNLTLDNQVYDNYNVCCKLQGKTKDEIVIGAHHDAVKLSPGADDNGSGTAGVIEIARVLKLQNIKPHHTIRFMTFAAEEAGLHGSKYDAFESAFLNKNIELMINMDMISNSSSDSVNFYKLSYHDTHEFYAELANNISETCTGMSSNYKSFAAVSDHYWYSMNKFPALYFHENEFSQVYHSPEDNLENTNKIYASRLLKTVLSNLLAFDNFSKDTEIELNDQGDGNSIALYWENKDNHISEVYIYPKDSSYHKIATTNSDTLLIKNLEEGKHYNCFIKQIDEIGHFYLSDEEYFKLSNIPPTPEWFEAYGITDSILFNWEEVKQNDIVGYNIYKGPAATEKINEVPIKQLSYTYQQTDYENYYYYSIKAIDKDGNESKKSNLQGAKPGTHSYLSDSIEVLVLIDVNSNPLLGEQVEQFFQYILDGEDPTILLLDNQSALPESILKHSKSVIYCIPDHREAYSNINYYRSYLIDYLKEGGNLLFSTANANMALSGFNRMFPNDIPTESDINKYLKVQKADHNINSHFNGAKSTFADYPDIEIDLTLVKQDYIDFVHSVEGNKETQNIYSYQSEFGQNNSQMNNLPVGFEYIEDDFNLVFLSFPLCYLNLAQSKKLINYVLNYRFKGLITGMHTNNTVKHLKAYPNPANHKLNLMAPEKGIIEVYNILGNLKTRKIIDAGITQLDITELAPGCYIIIMKTEQQTLKTKILVN